MSRSMLRGREEEKEAVVVVWKDALPVKLPRGRMSELRRRVSVDRGSVSQRLDRLASVETVVEVQAVPLRGMSSAHEAGMSQAGQVSMAGRRVWLGLGLGLGLGQLGVWTGHCRTPVSHSQPGHQKGN